MNWWNTAGNLLGYRKNRRVNAPFTETQKRIAVQLKEYYRVRRTRLKDEQQFREEIRRYVDGKISKLEQLYVHSMLRRANPSQYFHRPDGTMTWVDCTSRATYAAKYVYQNGYVDFDGVCRIIGCDDVHATVLAGQCENLGVTDHFVEGHNSVKAECFAQKNYQRTVREWVDALSIQVLPERCWLLEKIGHVRTDPYKNHEQLCIDMGIAPGVNEMLYGFKTTNTIAQGSVSASNQSGSTGPSYVSSPSSASRASDASSASNAGCTGFTGNTWIGCPTAITCPDGLVYPKEFRANIFAIAGNWKIDAAVVSNAKLGWFDPFSGHGTSPLYAARYKIRYLGFDTNTAAFDEYLNTIQEELFQTPGVDVRIECADSTVFRPELIGQFDLCYTSPPYFNFEEYGGNRGHYDGIESYDEFHEKIIKPVFRNVMQYLTPGGVLALQTEKNKTALKKWREVILSLGYHLISEGITGQEQWKYSMLAKRDQSLLVFAKPS